MAVTKAKLEPIHGTKRAERRADLVFVHGLDGDPLTTWQQKDQPDTLWPEWLADDLKDVWVWSLGYPAASSAWLGHAMPLTDRARNILDLLVHDDLGRGDRPLIFVTHSMGGLVVKQALRVAHDSDDARIQEIVSATQGLVFLATPHAGSDLTIWMKRLGWILRPNVTIRNLTRNDAPLRDLNLWFRNFASKTKLQCLTYFETIPTRFTKAGPQILGKTLGWFPAEAKVVDENSADLGLPGMDPIGVDHDHLTICRPASRDDQVYRGVLKFVREKCLPSTHAPPSPPNSEPTAPAIMVGVPPFNREFIPRAGYFKAIDDALGSSHAAALTTPAAIHGQGGIGKTQLAQAYAYARAKRYRFVFWISAETPTLLEAELGALAGPLKLPEVQSPSLPDRIEAVRRWLDAEDGWLLVLDNADEPEAIRPYLPAQPQGHILLTSRRSTWDKNFRAVQVRVMDRSESIRLLWENSDRGDQDPEGDADALAHALGDLPLALDQAAHYIRESRLSFGNYLKSFQTHLARLLKEGDPPAGYSLTIHATLDLAMQKITSPVGRVW